MRNVLIGPANDGIGHYCVGWGAACYMFVSLFAHVFSSYCLFYGALYNRTCWEKVLCILIKKIWKC